MHEASEVVFFKLNVAIDLEGKEKNNLNFIHSDSMQ